MVGSQIFHYFWNFFTFPFLPFTLKKAIFHRKFIWCKNIAELEDAGNICTRNKSSNFGTSTDVSNDDESMNLAFTNSIIITNGVLIKFVDNEMKKDPVE